MSRYRNYGQARGTRTYLSRREEFGMTEEEKHATYLRRKAAAEEAEKNAGIRLPITSHRPAGPTACEIPRAVDEERALCVGNRATSVGHPQPLPQSGDLFAELEDEEEEDGLSHAPRA